MFALLAVVFAVVGLVLSVAGNAIPAWLLWVVLACMGMHMLVGGWPFGTIIKVNRRNP